MASAFGDQDETSRMMSIADRLREQGKTTSLQTGFSTSSGTVFSGGAVILQPGQRRIQVLTPSVLLMLRLYNKLPLCTGSSHRLLGQLTGDATFNRSILLVRVLIHFPGKILSLIAPISANYARA